MDLAQGGSSEGIRVSELPSTTHDIAGGSQCAVVVMEILHGDLALLSLSYSALVFSCLETHDVSA
jgi:hypothetical protein